SFSAAFGLRDPVIQMTNFVDDGVSLRAELLSGRVNADPSEFDAQPDLVLLRERLRHARVSDQSKPQRTRQSRGLTRYRPVGGVDTEAAAFERDAELRKGLRPEGCYGKHRPSMRLGNVHVANGLLPFEPCDLDRSIGGLRGSDGLVKRRHLGVQRGRNSATEERE